VTKHTFLLSSRENVLTASSSERFLFFFLLFSIFNDKRREIGTTTSSLFVGLNTILAFFDVRSAFSVVESSDVFSLPESLDVRRPFRTGHGRYSCLVCNSCADANNASVSDVRHCRHYYCTSVFVLRASVPTRVDGRISRFPRRGIQKARRERVCFLLSVREPFGLGRLQ